MSLQQTDARIQAILDAAVDPIITIWDDGLVESFNSAAEQLFGMSEAEIVGNNINMLMPSPVREQHDAYLARYMRTGESQIIGVGREIDAMKKDGTIFPAHLSVSRVGLGEGVVGEKSTLFTGIIRDLTEQKRVKAELIQAKEGADAANVAKSEFLANVSHELRTPLNSMLILAKLLFDNREGNLTAKQVNAAKVIHSGGQGLLDLIDDILNLSKVDAGRVKVEGGPVKLSELVHRLQNQFASLADRKGMSFTVRVAEGLPQVVKIDLQKTEQILKNLLANAFKFTKEGAVDVLIQRADVNMQFCFSELTPDSALAFSVADTGIGVPPEKLQTIFETFRQGDSSSTREYGGTGLGLTISRKLAHFLGGELLVQSDEGKGSTFTLYLPLASVQESHEVEVKSPATPENSLDENGTAEQGVTKDATSQVEDALEQGEPENGEAVQSRLRGTKVLLVDDDSSNVYAIASVLAQSGVEVVVAEDGQVALDILERGTEVDVILMDMLMPVMDGYEAMRKIRQNAKIAHLPIIALTASAMRGDREKCMEAQADDYLAKPVEMDELRAKIVHYRELTRQTC